MSASAAASLSHRTVSSIRGGGQSTRDGVPATPIRPLSSSVLGSPSGGSGRVEEDALIVELGCRRIRVGFAGDPTPKRIITFDAESDKRTGDLRAWEPGYTESWRTRTVGCSWGGHQELFQLECRGQDLALVGDRLERGLRDALARHLLIDSKPRRVSLVLPPALPLPILSSVLDTIFTRFHAPSISLLSSPATTTFAAGIRSALVVDIGWHETTVSGIYEYREVNTWRTTRAGKMLLEETRDFLVGAIDGRAPGISQDTSSATDNVISFEDCEEVATRILWCKKPHRKPSQNIPEGLSTLHEEDETETIDPAEDTAPTSIFLPSCRPPRTVQIPFSRLSEPCEKTFFDTPYALASFDDDELPLHLLVYLSLLKLPMDVRAVCMSRIIFTGGCSSILGIRGRIFDEVCLLAEERGWDPIQGRGVHAYRNNPKLKRNGDSVNGSEGSIPTIQTSPSSEGKGESNPSVHPAHVPPEEDPIETAIWKEKGHKPPVQGTLRVIDSMGPWAGASLATQLKIPALAAVERDLWLAQGLGGATKTNEIDVQAQQTRTSRQSMGPGGLLRGQGVSGGNWTLGVWGVA
ncbi:hypothetical protein BKA67DRAFT_551926 [Truncatella angustata]|uniref:Actin-related protein 10 n=1 Tax=Truncatella angustata TaxID=152316 RepID=A0A9P8UQ79_9PEZI|nr:uncharacterized protein BKA67DRAFT_551926 [Truncatella angustata]KAH6656442.1 hypothetical protein BKA67DRAFT_551926 [Truncatella angustata]